MRQIPSAWLARCEASLTCRGREANTTLWVNPVFCFHRGGRSVVTVRWVEMKVACPMDNDYKGDYAYSPRSAASASAMRNGNRHPRRCNSGFSSLHHQLLLLEVQSQAYERQLAQLREQVAQIDDLKPGMVELREHLGENSSNSSKPPSSDLPRQPQQVQRQPSGRKPGGQPDRPEVDDEELKAVAPGGSCH